MPKVTEEDHGTFTKRISKNDIAPKDGSEPLTVVEFSLTNDIRDSLKKAIDDYRANAKNDHVALAKIITDHFPPEVLESLGHLAKEEGAPATVYVVKNLPEITREDMPKEILHLHKRGQQTYKSLDLDNWMRVNSYSSYIGQGVSLALNFEPQQKFEVSRFKNFNEALTGGTLHTHEAPISLFGGVISNGAETRFTDVRSMVDEAASRPASSPQVIVSHGEDHYWDTGSISLHELPDQDRSWSSRGMAVEIIPDAQEKNNQNQKKWNSLVNRHSQKVVVGSGDLALWTEEGGMFHQALPKRDNSKLPKDSLIRYMLGWEQEHPQER